MDRTTTVCLGTFLLVKCSDDSAYELARKGVRPIHISFSLSSRVSCDSRSPAVGSVHISSPLSSKVQQRLDFYTKGCKCSKGDTLCNPQKGHCGCTHNHRQCGPAYKCSLTKEKCCNKSEPSGDHETSLQVVPPHCTHTSEETHTLQQTHTPEEMYSESEDEENTDSEDEAHTHFKRETHLRR